MTALERRVTTPRAGWAALCITLGASLILISCGVLPSPQDWGEELGPVVPHDSFPGDCSLCHDGDNWHEVREDFDFDHEEMAGMPLVGAHAKARCLFCHNDRGDVAQFAAQGCRGCHEDVHRNQLGSACGDCHDQNTWLPRASIVEHGRTRFPLVGAHAGLACFRCHEGAETGDFLRVDVNCETCHAAEITRSTALDHVAQGLTEDCERCHRPTDWRDATFPHPASFPLTGGHGALDCAVCHGPAGTAQLTPVCEDCHLDDYLQSTSPNHIQAGLPTECESCHTPIAWQPASKFDHGGFPLTGSHLAIPCESCHGGGVFGGLPSDCVDCHLDDYQGATPDHVASGLPTTCETCHTTTSWSPASFGHGFFPLTGGHAGLACDACHASGVFAGLPSDCVDCHLSDYQGASPDHVASGFSTDCTVCHTTATWDGAVFVHSFPIDSGDHSGFDCTDCHVVPSDPTAFSCTVCHGVVDMADEHSGVPGYVWSSPACLSCHPDGQD